MRASRMIVTLNQINKAIENRVLGGNTVFGVWELPSPRRLHYSLPKPVLTGFILLAVWVHPAADPQQAQLKFC
jgi:hypothetical protein